MVDHANAQRPSRRGVLLGAAASALVGGAGVARAANTYPSMPRWGDRLGPLSVPFLLNGDIGHDAPLASKAAATFLSTFLGFDAAEMVGRVSPKLVSDFSTESRRRVARIGDGSALLSRPPVVRTRLSTLVPQDGQRVAAVTVAAYAALLRWHAAMAAGLLGLLPNAQPGRIPSPDFEALGLAFGEACGSLGQARRNPVDVAAPRLIAPWQQRMVAMELDLVYGPIIGTPVGAQASYLQYATSYGDLVAGHPPALPTGRDRDMVVAVNDYVSRDLLPPVLVALWKAIV